MTDEELVAIRADVEEASRVLSGRYTVVDMKLATLTVSYAAEFTTLTPVLLDEVERLRALARIVADEKALWLYDRAGYHTCRYCGTVLETSTLAHAATCLYVQARALLDS